MSPIVSIAYVFIISVSTAFAKKASTSSQRDLKYISCDVCTKAVEELYETAAEARKVAPYNKIDEESIQDLIEGLCKSDEKSGEWIRELDIVTKNTEKGDFLVLDTPGGMSKCKEECNTIVESCKKLIDDDIDADDLSAVIYKNKLTRKELKSKVCREWSGRCSSKAKPINYQREELPFEEISEKDLQMEQMMAQMKAAGMGGMSMYNKDDMEGMMANGGMPGMGGGYDDYGYGYGGDGGMGGYGGGMPGMGGYGGYEGDEL
jgi:hypothetical protein